MSCKGCQRRQEWLDKHAPTVGKLTRKTNEVVTKAVKKVRNIK